MLLGKLYKCIHSSRNGVSVCCDLSSQDCAPLCVCAGDGEWGGVGGSSWTTLERGMGSGVDATWTTLERGMGWLRLGCLLEGFFAEVSF